MSPMYFLSTLEGMICGPGLLSRYSDLLWAGQPGDRIPGGQDFLPWGPPSLVHSGNQVFPGGKVAGVCC